MPMLDFKDCSLYYTVKGKGIPIIFIHPPVLTSVNFIYQVDELSRYFQVITFDIRGHGRSTSSIIPVTYPIIVEDIKNLMNHLEIKQAFLCGYSTGASIVLEFLLTSRDKALGGFIVSGMSEVSDWRLTNRIHLAKNLIKVGALPVLAWSISKSNSNSKELFENMLQEAKKGDPANIMQYYDYSLTYKAHPLEKIALPISLIYGEKDKPFYQYAKQLQEKLSSYELTFIKDIKHQIPTKAAREFNKIIQEFILKISGSGGE